MSSKSKVQRLADKAQAISNLHFAKFGVYPIKEGYRFKCKKGFVVEWFKVSPQVLSELIKRKENEKSGELRP